MHELTLQTEASAGAAGVNKPGVWPWVIAAAALLALIASINNDMRSIQSSLSAIASAVVSKHLSDPDAPANAASGQHSVRLSIDGRDISLHGKIAAATDRDAMVSELRALDGVRIVRDEMQAIDPRQQANVARLEFQQALEQLDASSILFNPGSTALLTGSEPALAKLAALLQADPARQIKITGHTDNSGNAQINLQISQQRAQSVADFLMAKGVNEEQLIVQGYGHTRPLYSNDTEAGRSRNRRIEFIFMK